MSTSAGRQPCAIAVVFAPCALTTHLQYNAMSVHAPYAC
jgi:hypothetical protein